MSTDKMHPCFTHFLIQTYPEWWIPPRNFQCVKSKVSTLTLHSGWSTKSLPGFISARGWVRQILSESHLAQLCVEAEQGSDISQNTMLCRAWYFWTQTVFFKVYKLLLVQEDLSAEKICAQILRLHDKKNELIPMETLSLTRLHFSRIQAVSSIL